MSEEREVTETKTPRSLIKQAIAESKVRRWLAGASRPGDCPTLAQLHAAGYEVRPTSSDTADPICQCGQPKSIHGDIEFFPQKS